MSQELQDSGKFARKSLKTLQHVASDRENLVGRSPKTLKQQLLQETSGDVELRRKNVVSNKETQVDLPSKISVEDLTDPKGASENYWQRLAEKRQVALQEVLDENERLRKIVNDLKEENRQFKTMLEEANSFIEVIKEEIGNGTDDTGIDVNDVSTADETLDEESSKTETKDE